MKWNSRIARKDVIELTRSAPMGGNGCVMDDAVEIELGRRYNGSGGNSFGGADNWPHLKVNVSFPVGAESQRNALAEKIRALIDEHVPER